MSKEKNLAQWHPQDVTYPSEFEKQALNKAQTAYDADPHAVAPWCEVQARLRKRMNSQVLLESKRHTT